MSGIAHAWPYAVMESVATLTLRFTPEHPQFGRESSVGFVSKWFGYTPPPDGYHCYVSGDRVAYREWLRRVESLNPTPQQIALQGRVRGLADYSPGWPAVEVEP